MKKIEIKEINKNEFYINMFSKTLDDKIISNGQSFSKNDLYNLYIELREIFTKNN